jgi:hypothetical protein
MRAFIRTTPGLRTVKTITTTTRLFHTSSPLTKMASPTDLPFKMHVTPDNTGLWHIKQTEEAAKKVSDLLQKDMEVRLPPSLHHPLLHFSPLTNLPSHLATETPRLLQRRRFPQPRKLPPPFPITMQPHLISQTTNRSPTTS